MAKSDAKRQHVHTGSQLKEMIKPRLASMNKVFKTTFGPKRFPHERVMYLRLGSPDLSTMSLEEYWGND